MDTQMNTLRNNLSNDVKNEIPGFAINVAPEYIYQYLSKRGIGNDFLITREIVENRLSTEDLATLFYVNRSDLDIEIDKDMWLGTGHFISFIEEMRGVEGSALYNKINHARDLSYNKAVREQIQNNLKAVSDEKIPQYGETSPSYEFIEMGPKIWLILKPGFLSELKDSKKKMQFYRDYLTAVGVVAPVAHVVNMNVYSHFVEQLLK